MNSPGNQHRQTAFPVVPPSLSAGEDGMRDYYTTRDTQRPGPHTVQNITPYLGLRARLSQVWINKWTILLLLVLARTLIAVTGLHHDLASAKKEALSACTGVESVGSAMASMPHYLSAGVNELAASGIEKAINGLMSMLLLSITGVEEIVVFYINMLTSTYVCLITFAVSGSLHAAIQIAEDVNSFLNKTLGDIEGDIASDAGSFQNDLNKFVGGLNSIPEAFGKKGDIPTLDINSSLSKLENIALPPTIDEGLNKLNASIPTFADVNNFTNNAIRLPFEEVKKLINDSMGRPAFDRSLFPVPQKEQLTFCSDNNDINTFFDGLADLINLARRIFIGVLVVLAILICIPMAYREIMRWRTMQQRAKLVGDNSMDKLDVIYIASRPYTAQAGLKAASTFGSTKRQILTRWVIAYCTSVPALFVLSLGIAGLFSCLCQYILLRSVEKEVPALTAEVGEFADKVMNVLNNASGSWANGTNAVITKTNADINHDVFGWVNTTTGALNDTLNTFVNDMSNVLNTTFGGTVLYDPITEVLNCLIGLKIAGIQKGLDWVSDNAHVEFPLLPADTFSLGAAASLASNNTGNSSTSSFLAAPGSDATDQISAAVDTVATHLADAIRTEALIATTILLIWFLIFLMGFLRAVYLACKREKAHGLGGPSYAGDIPMQKQESGFVTRDRPQSEQAPAYEPSNTTTTHAAFEDVRTDDPFADSHAHETSAAGAWNGFPSFRQPGPGERVLGLGLPRAGVRDGERTRENDADWSDRKLGFAGQRNGVDTHLGAKHARGSSYGDVVGGDEKS